MINLINNTKGMTLIELLGAIIILFIISALMFPILISGMKSADNIQQETMLRDEADFLIASFVKELYVMKETEIQAKNLPKRGTKDYYIIKTNGEKSGFINNILKVAGNDVSLNNSSITLLPSQIIDLEKGQYKIILKLKYEGRKSREMEFVNIVSTINDKEIEAEEAS